ncbi:helix-turn-helix domain-containing protein [Paenibacillus sp. PR3]|uniref:Helix-turn-helix domain-containing protein n=1 Tax=Paenibacillus terricola TaxID=2763503 RepID=A0ABR8MXN4_9BACL|nr:helix-turn-helix domain-containing protein [Paenibacillus terricola]MBD3920728.1 helix-turn-helix domain-containing protein [Paenibacillus terricola]
MEQSKADLILHPIRLRIIQALLPEGNHTTQQLAERMSDIPQATLYRHLNTLLKAGLIHVVEERRNRGTVEKVYALAHNAAELTPDDVTETASAQHMELFVKFVASLLSEFGAYVGQERYNMVEDGVSFRKIELSLTDEEYRTLLTEQRAIAQRYADNKPTLERRLRMISTVVIPETKSIPTNRTEGDEEDEHGG